MPELHLYEYAVVRLVPRVERDEFMNVGLVMLCRKLNWLHMDYRINPDLFSAFCPQTAIDEIINSLDAFRDIALGREVTSPIVHWEVAERFRWLTAVRSSILQTSRPHTGKTQDPESTFRRLFEQMVL